MRLPLSSTNTLPHKHKANTKSVTGYTPLIGAWAIALTIALTGFATDAWAQETPTSETTATTQVELSWDPVVDYTVAGISVGAGLLMETILKKPLGPHEECYWCTPPAMDESIRDALVWDDPHAGEVATLYSGIVLPPISAFGLTALAAVLDDRTGESWVNSLIITEAVGITMVLTNAAKWTFGRRRPSVYNETPRGDEFSPGDRNLSFFSGHSSLAWSLATSSGTVASMRGYRWAPLVWASGVSLAAFTAYGRIGADAHWFTDVLTGSLVGGGLGFAIPYFFHSPQSPDTVGGPSVNLLPMIGDALTGVAAIGRF